MGNTHNPSKIQKMFLKAAQTPSKIKNKKIITFILKTTPHEIIENLPQNTTQCTAPDDCIPVIAHIATEYLTHSKIPYHETHQWMHTTTKINIIRTHSF